MSTNLPHIMAVSDASIAGAITYWRLSGAATNPSALQDAWVGAGLDAALLPTLPEPETALRRAAGAQRAKHRLVRPAPKGGHIIVGERTQGDNLDWSEELRVKLDKVGRLVIEPNYHAAADELRTAYNSALGELNETDISSWIVNKLIPLVGGVGLRPTGGIYFIPRPQVDRWGKMVDAIMAASEHVVFRIPAMTSSDAVDAVLDAVVQEAQAEAEAIEQAMQKGDLGKRALESRMSLTERVEAKVVSYEGLLGRKLDAMRERLDKLRAGLSVAIMSAEGNAAQELASL